MARLLTEVILDGGVQNVNFFEGRLLTGRDLRDQLKAERRYDRRLGKAAGSGVIAGLEVSVFRDGSDNQPPEFDVTAGLAINEEGQTIELPHQERIQLARSLAEPEPEAGQFSTCGNPGDTLVPNGVGIYILLISPASGLREQAPAGGLKNKGVLACCGKRYDVEGASFRVQQLFVTELDAIAADTRAELLGGLLGATDLQSRSRLRNIVAHLCFGTEERVSFAENPFAADSGEAAFLHYGALDELRATGALTSCEVPLALFYWTFEGIGFLDMWAVRRRLVTTPVSSDWPSFSTNRRAAEGDARLIQFQQHLDRLIAESPAPALIEARRFFRYLPPAGFLPVQQTNTPGIDENTFFTGLNASAPVTIEGDVVLPITDLSLTFPPIDLESNEEIRRCEVRENRSPAPGESYPPYLFFADADLPFFSAGRPSIHVTDVLLGSGAALGNDTALVVEDLIGGIRIRCDASVRPETAKPETCFVSLELPYPLNFADREFWGNVGLGALGSSALILNATIAVQGTDIVWTPAGAVATWLQSSQFQALLRPSDIRVRLTLLGNFISDLASARFLDGDAFGAPQGGGGALSLILPSGDGTTGGKFEMFFRLTQTSRMTFTALATSLFARSAGITESIGDIFVIATGGRVTPVGRPVPRFDVRIRLNVNLTSPIIDATRNQPDGVLVIDSPTVLNTTAMGSSPPVLTGAAGGVNYNNGSAPNIFPAAIDSGELLFRGIPVDAPSSGSRMLRLKNIRANASILGGATGVSPIMAVITIRDEAGSQVFSSVLTVGLLNPALTFAIASTQLDGIAQQPPLGIPAFAGVNRGLLQNPNFQNAEINLRLRFQEGFGSAFKRLDEGPGGLETITDAQETAWDNQGPNALPVRQGSPALPSIGIATQGTRLMVRFSNVPADYRVFVTIRDVPCTPSGAVPANPVARLVTGAEPNGAGGVLLTATPANAPRADGIPIIEVPVTGGAQFAVWEIVGGDASASESICVGVALAAGPSTFASGTGRVEGLLAPLSTAVQPAPASAANPVPRFVAASAGPINAFTVIVLL